MKLRDVLTPRALAAWAGTNRLSTLAYRLPSAPAQTEVAALFALLVAGDELPVPSRYAGLVRDLTEGNRARYSILPLGPSLLVCDRLDADGGTELVCWPDDSSYHLALAVPPGRRERWLDIACGSGFAPLMRPDLAAQIVCGELNSRAVAYAKRGAELSGQSARVEIHQADLTGDIRGTFELVSCNAPIPADVGPLWRATADHTFFPRLFEQVPRVLAPSGMFVLHAALDHVASLVDQLPGERVTVSYVPEGGRQFGIVWWRPDAEPRHIVARRELTPEQPHLTHADRLAALGQ